MSKRHLLIARNWENDCITASPDLLQLFILHQLNWHGNVDVVYNSYIKFYYMHKGTFVVAALLDNFCTPSRRAVDTRLAFTQ